MTKFFRVKADSNFPSRWYLKSPMDSRGREVDPREFTRCQEYGGDFHLHIPLRREGDMVDFNFCDFDMPVISRKVNEALERIVGSQVQRIPVQVGEAKGQFELLNVLDAISCIDEGQTKFEKWTEGDGRPEKVGQFRMITRLRINAAAANGHHIFRISEWRIALVVSDDIKRLLEEMNVTGIKFELLN